MFYIAFAQRSAPGTNYKLQELRDVLGNSIRGARHHLRKVRNSITHAAAMLEIRNDHVVEVRDENHLNHINEFAMSTNNIQTNERQIETRSDSFECL